MTACACGRGPVKVRSNGRSLGRCAECLSDRAGKFPVGTVRKHGRIWRRKTEAGWEPCNEDGTPLPPVIRGTLSEIMAKYRLMPVPLPHLVRAGLLEHAWERDENGIEKPMVGLSPHGRPSFVWQPTDEGVDALLAHMDEME